VLRREMCLCLCVCLVLCAAFVCALVLVSVGLPLQRTRFATALRSSPAQRSDHLSENCLGPSVFTGLDYS
jgi:hypothetical protein